MLDIHFQNLESSCDRFVKIIKKIRNQQEETPAEFHSEIYKWSMDCLTIGEYTYLNKNVLTRNLIIF